MGTESDGLSQDELHRLGLARRPRPPRPPGKLLPFLKDLAPPWPRLGRTVLVAALLTMVARSFLVRTTEELGAITGLRHADVGQILLHALGNPIHVLSQAACMPYAAGVGVLAAPLALWAGFALLLRRSRPGLAILLLLVGATGAGWALFGPTGSPWGLSPVFPLLSLAGGATGAWLLFFVAGDPRRRASPERAALPLLLTAAIALNIWLAFTSPAGLLAYLVGRPPHFGSSWVGALPQIATVATVGRWTVAIVGFPLVLVPALIVTEGLGLRAALRTLLAAIRSQPVGMLLAHLGLALLAAIPLNGLFTAIFGASCWYLVLIFALVSGAVSGVFLYFTTRVARAARRCVERAR